MWKHKDELEPDLRTNFSKIQNISFSLWIILYWPFLFVVKCTALEQKLKRLSEDLSCQRQNAESARCSLEQKLKEKEKEFQEVRWMDSWGVCLEGSCWAFHSFVIWKEWLFVITWGVLRVGNSFVRKRLPIFSFTLPSFSFRLEKRLSSQNVLFYLCPLISCKTCGLANTLER